MEFHYYLKSATAFQSNRCAVRTKYNPNPENAGTHDTAIGIFVEIVEGTCKESIVYSPSLPVKHIQNYLVFYLHL